MKQILAGVLFVLFWATFEAWGEINLTQARVVLNRDASPREALAARVLVEEVEKRSGIRWPVQNPSEGAQGDGTIRIVPTRSIDSLGSPQVAPPKPEGFTVRIDGNRIDLIGDERGILFGVGHLLRKIEIRPGHIVWNEPVAGTSSPTAQVRGHQLGYRPKTNSYDAWDLPQWEQYIRELALFGTNAIEIIPPKSDDDDLSPHFPKPKIEMMVGMSKLADAYGLDVWIWYPAIDGDYAQPAIVDRSLKEWGEVLTKLPRVDAVFVPTGDPGNTRPSILMPLLEKQTAQLKRIHPNATMWISIQGLIKPWFDEMITILKKEPAWLTGVCYGPQTRLLLPELRQILPRRYPIRRYPDITHCIWCQYPVTDWDVAFAMTEGREPINPRPVDQAAIYRAFDDDAIGFITYSEGCNDDVNKFVWSGLGWNAETSVDEILLDYARLFIGPDHAEDFARGVRMLEENWRGPVATNETIPKTLNLFKALEKKATPELLANWRFQQALYRAYYDAFVQAKASPHLYTWQSTLPETLSDEWIEARIAEVEAQLVAFKASPLRQRVFDLADDLFRSIKMQLSVPKYQAIAVWRGANLDSVDTPLQDEDYLLASLRSLQKLKESERAEAWKKMLPWLFLPQGARYDDLGDPQHQPHAIRQKDTARDPASLRSAYVGFEPEPGLPRAWITYMDGLFDVPVVLAYNDLDGKAKYRVRVVYAAATRKYPVRLLANDGLEIHPLMDRPMPPRPLEFAIPEQATKEGRLKLSFQGDPNRGGNGRGPQVSAVWLIPEESPLP